MSTTPEQDLRSRLTAAKASPTGQPPVQPLKVIEEPMFALSVQELRDAVATNPEHPNAEIFLRAVNGKHSTEVCYVERIDLEALLDNADVRVVEKIEGELVVRRKKLVPRHKPATPAPKPAST